MSIMCVSARVCKGQSVEARQWITLYIITTLSSKHRQNIAHITTDHIAGNLAHVKVQSIATVLVYSCQATYHKLT